MKLIINPLKPGTDFAAEVLNLDLQVPLIEEEFARIRDAFYTYSVLVLRNQNITDDQQIEFSKRFGALELSLIHI